VRVLLFIVVPDLWVQKWRRTQAHGDVIVVRFADDFARYTTVGPEAWKPAS
jgi:hypothetical protein